MFHSPEFSLALATNVPLDRHGNDVGAQFTLSNGAAATFVLQQTERGQRLKPISEAAAAESFNATVRFWRGWLSHSVYRGRWREMVNRSALTLKLLTYRPTGAIVAAPTTSLPEHVGGERNWDYRYTWVRDAAFSLYALLRLGFTEEAGDFMGWLTDRFGETSLGRARPAADHVRDRRPRRPERGDARSPRGLRSARRRCGSATAPPTQLQLDIYGELIDSVYLYNKYGEPISYDSWTELQKIVDWLCDNWDRPDEGIWEMRGGQPGLHLFAADVAGSRSSGRCAWPAIAACRRTWSSGSMCATRSRSRS